MEKTFSKVEELVGHVKDYVDNQIDTVKLSAAEKISKLLAGFISLAVSLLVLGLFILFASFALALAFGKLTGEWYWGFLIVAGFYLLLGIFIWMAREKLLRLPILNVLLKQLFNKADEKDQQYSTTEN